MLELATRDYRTPDEELRARVAALQERLRARGIAGAVLVQSTTVFYFAGSIVSGWLLVPAEGEPQLHVRRAVPRTEQETCWPVTLTRSTRDIVAAARSAFGDGSVGVELDTFPAAEYLKLADAYGGAFVDIAHDVRTVRARKSEWELQWVRRAAHQVRTAMEETAAEVAPGMREIDVAILAEGVLRREGHQGLMRMRRFGGEMFYGQVAGGANAAVPAALDAPLGGSGRYPAVGKGASERKLEHGELLVLDLMGACNGYLSDCTRLVAVGGIDAVDDELLEAHDWCVSVLATVADAARPGTPPSQLYRRAVELAAAAGHAERFMGAAPDQARFVGHGIGLEVDEYPFLAPGFDEPLAAGMVFALEPKLVFPGRAAVGIEDAFIVTDGAPEVLEAPPRAVLPA